MTVLGWPLRNRHVVVVLSLAVLCLGGRALLEMPRQDTPSISIHQALVVAAYPGADVAPVEQQLTRPLETHLFSFTEVDVAKTRSITRNNLTVIIVELHDWVPDMAGFWSRLRLGLSEMKPLSLPATSLGPVVDSDFGDSVALLVGISSPERSYAELRGDLHRIEEALRRVPGMGRIKSLGERREAVYIEADSQRLAEYQVGLPEVVAALELQNRRHYSGQIEVGDLDVPLHPSGPFATVDEVASQVVFRDPVGDRLVRIGDVASVERRLLDPVSHLRINGRDDPGLLLSIEMQPGRNIVEFGEAVDAALVEVGALLAPDLEFTVINDQPAVVDESVTHFVREFFIAVGAVVAVTMLLLPFRVAMIAAMAIPVTIAFTFAMLDVLGVQLHEVSLAALIVVLGMVVDDAIVIADNYLEKLDEGLPHAQAAIRAAGELTVPIFTATIAIVFAFAPLGLMLTGAVGEFILALPITVAVSLLSSFVVAMMLTPLLCQTFIKRGLKDQPASLGARVLDGVQRLYNPVLSVFVRRPALALGVGALSVVAGVGLLGLVKMKFFPAAERAQFVIEVDLPLGSRLAATDRVVQQIEAELARDEIVTDFAAFVGVPAPRVYYSFAPEFPRPSYGMLLVGTPSPEATVERVAHYQAALQGRFPGARINVNSFQQGIPVDAPVEVRLVGPAVDQLRELADQVKAKLVEIPGAQQVRDDFLDGFSLDLDLNMELANREGFTSGSIAQQLMVGFAGVPITEIWEGETSLPLVLRLADPSRANFSALEELMVRSPFGVSHVPLHQLVSFDPVWSPSQIARRNGARTLTVRANPADGVLPSEVLGQLRPALAELDLPPGYFIEIGGEYEGQVETFGEMAGALAASDPPHVLRGDARSGHHGKPAWLHRGGGADQLGGYCDS